MRRRYSNLPHRWRHIGWWRKPRHQRLDLAPAPTAGSHQDVLMVLGSEVPMEQADGCERHRAGGERLEDHGKAPARSRRDDAVACRILGEAKRLRAVVEE